MELDWLETFLAVVDSGGFTSASTQVHRSQSRVSAHIANLEKELGVRLIDRARRPATVTEAGRLLAGHARSVLAEIATARSAIGVLQTMESESLSVLTSPSIGTALFPGVLAGMLARHPRASVSLSERGWQDGEPGELRDGVAMAVLPTLPPPHAASLREQVLWREPIQVVVPADHELADERGPVHPARLSAYPLVISGPAVRPQSEVVMLLSGKGFALHARATVDDPRTLVEMTRRGLGVGVESAVALENAGTADLVVLDIDDPDMVSEVAAYWYDTLLSTDLGQSLHRTVLSAPLPNGAVPVVRSQRPVSTSPLLGAGANRH